MATCASDARKRSRTLLAELASRPRPGSPYLLEPDLKEGAGGRRDYDELTWTAAILTGSVQHDPSALVGLGHLTAEEESTLAASAETIAAARWSLALVGAGNLLSLDSLAELPPGLAEQTQVALAETALVLSRVRRRLTGRAAEPSTPLSADELFSLLDARRCRPWRHSRRPPRPADSTHSRPDTARS